MVNNILILFFRAILFKFITVIRLPITYNLTYELPKFISYFKHRERENLDNHWILKPWNLARSIDTTVTKNLNQIIRSQETGPKVKKQFICLNKSIIHKINLY
jgi:hypothetical protein